MKGLLRLAWRHLCFHRGRSLLLVIALALSATLPLAVRGLVRGYGEALRSRARRTPLVVGAPGSRFELTLNGLYFRGRPPATTSMAELERLEESDLALAIPVLARRTAGGFPIVGTSHDYYAFRDLTFRSGRAPGTLGEAVLGARVARELDLEPGDTLLSDRGGLYELSAGYPLRLDVVGVLADAVRADDGAVFVDVHTAWILEGIGHGHDPAEEAADEALLDVDAGPEGSSTAASTEERRVLDASVVEYTRVTPDNIDTFHFHGEPADLPLTAILVDPRDDRARTLLKGRYRVSDDAQLQVPSEVIEELMGFVFRIKAFFDANVLLVGVATGLLLILIVLLDLRARRAEVLTLARIGCARGTVVRIVLLEIGLLLAAGLLLAWCLSAALLPWIERGLAASHGLA